MKRRILQIGEKFHYLTVISGPIKARHTKYIFECDCGKTREAAGTHVLIGDIKSCGCKNFINNHKNQKYGLQEASFRAKAANYRANAKTRGIKFTLSIEETANLLSKNCYYCNSVPECKYNVILANRRKKLHKGNLGDYDILYNGIDRLDNNIGYTITNTVPCCQHCNTMKLDYTLEEFREKIIKIYNNFINK